jgi:hypothetical protein
MSNFISNLYYNILPKKDEYLIYSKGNSNLIISAPHSGNVKPISIKSRTYGNRSRDTYTLELIKKIIETLPKKPYYIYANIHRSKVDFNRDIEEACQENPKMERLWNTWNNVLNDYLNTVRFYYNKGLYIDLHSHNNSDKFQIGYGLSVRDYLILLDDRKIPTKNSTMHSLKEFSVDEYKSEHSILFGEFSILYNIQKHGYKVLLPKNDSDYLNGGRDIKEHTGKGIGSMQIECPISVLKKDFDGVAKALIDSINIFTNKFLREN